MHFTQKSSPLSLQHQQCLGCRQYHHHHHNPRTNVGGYNPIPIRKRKPHCHPNLPSTHHAYLLAKAVNNTGIFSGFMDVAAANSTGMVPVFSMPVKVKIPLCTAANTTRSLANFAALAAKAPANLYPTLNGTASTSSSSSKSSTSDSGSSSSSSSSGSSGTATALSPSASSSTSSSNSGESSASASGTTIFRYCACDCKCRGKICGA
ncbi:hypothetical protein DID88_000493 [Monilinia fructigena]|uniref:Uncharacterized protein n=1 Tax=Monilinia fructigena TaxID=38457 RepID=A0A395IIY7_9HELO|nr:hypothetical protein DID88_000493 [Monilinia fructigena]